MRRQQLAGAIARVCRAPAIYRCRPVTGDVTLEITNVTEQHTADEFRTALQPIIDTLEFEG